MSDDIELYRAWRDGDRDAGSRIIDRYLESIGRFFANKVTDPADIEDLVGATFERCAASLGKFQESSSFRTYLFGIARNVWRDYIKKKRRRGDAVDFSVTQLEDLGPSPSVLIGDRQEQIILLRALRQIPLELQVVIELSYFEKMTQAQIAETLGIPAGTAASRLRRGKRAVIDRIAELASDKALLESTMHGLQDWIAKVRAELDAEQDT